MFVSMYAKGGPIPKCEKWLFPHGRHRGLFSVFCFPSVLTLNMHYFCNKEVIKREYLNVETKMPQKQFKYPLGDPKDVQDLSPDD